jgi:ribonuclease R
LRGERTGIRYRLADRVTVQVARVDLEARRIEFRLVREQERKALIAGESEPASPRKDKRKGESVEERRARIERTQGRGAHSGGQRDKGAGGSSGLNRARGRGRR